MNRHLIGREPLAVMTWSHPEVDAAHRRLVCAVIISLFKDAQRDDEAGAWLESSELCADWLDVLNLADAFRRHGIPAITGRALWRQNGASQQAGRIHTARRVEARPNRVARLRLQWPMTWLLQVLESHRATPTSSTNDSVRICFCLTTAFYLTLICTLISQ